MEPMSYTVAFQSLGCSKNLVNTEQMMALCRAAGYHVTGEPRGAARRRPRPPWAAAMYGGPTVR